MGPHPAVAAVRLAVRRALAGQRPDLPVMVACSGGADSVALAAAVAFETARTGRQAGLVTIDHGLQDGSAAQAAAVAEWGYQLGLTPVQLIKVSVGRAGGPEAAARSARYSALAPLTASGLVLLGHTADDQAETVLLGLGRGSGTRSIAGMRPAAAGYLRPLLGLRRADTAAACDALGLPVWQDPHNQDPRYRRVRLRLEVLPLLDEVLAGGVVPALCRTASQLQDDLDALDLLAARALADARAGVTGAAVTEAGVGTDQLEVRALRDQPLAILSRVLKSWAEGAGAGPLTAEHVGQLVRLVTDWHGQDGVDLPGGCGAMRASGRLKLVAAGRAADPTTAADVPPRPVRHPMKQE